MMRSGAFIRVYGAHLVVVASLQHGALGCGGGASDGPADGGATTDSAATGDAGTDARSDADLDADTGAAPMDPVLAVQIAAGAFHTCLRSVSNEVLCWGRNENGQVGPMTGESCGGHACITRPRVVPGLSSSTTAVSQVALGFEHTCARMADGAVFCWGNNVFGQLGDGWTADTSKPRRVPGLSDVAEIALGYKHTCARKNDGTVLCWGRNEAGQLGDGTRVDRTVPTAVPGLVGVAGIALGYAHTCARKVDGSLLCWGSNVYGQLGDGTTLSRWTPTGVPGLGGVLGIALGEGQTCARKSDDTALCWGDNHYGQLGDGSQTARSAPALLSGLGSVGQIALGWSHGCARKLDGTVQCWGDDWFNELGYATTTSCGSKPEPHPCSLTPSSVAGLSGVAEIALGDGHSCARRTDGTVLCWGYRALGAVGDGPSSGLTVASPTVVMRPKDAPPVGDEACGAADTAGKCSQCCAVNHDAATQAANDTLLACACKPGNCDLDCKGIACASPPSGSDPTCVGCLYAAKTGVCKSELDACKKAACADYYTCVGAQACADKPFP